MDVKAVISAESFARGLEKVAQKTAVEHVITASIRGTNAVLKFKGILTYTRIYCTTWPKSPLQYKKPHPATARCGFFNAC